MAELINIARILNDIYDPTAGALRVSGSGSTSSGSTTDLTPYWTSAQTLTYLGVETLAFQIEFTTGVTYYLDPASYYGYNISGVSLMTDSSECVVSLYHQASGITNLTGLTIDTTIEFTSAGGNNSVSVGDNVSIVVDSNTSASYVIGSLKLIRV